MLACGDARGTRTGYSRHRRRGEKACEDCLRGERELHGRQQCCEICGALYQATHRDQRTCGRKCGSELQRLNSEASGRWSADGPSCRIYVIVCAECGQPTVRRSSSAVTCGPACARRRLIGQVLDRHYGYKASGMDKDSLLVYLAERDHHRCGICHRPVRAKSGPMRPSIDHIVPRSCGGSNELGNLQLAHHWCNLSKNNRGGGQLLLVG